MDIECDGIQAPATGYCFDGRCEDHEECTCSQEFNPWCCDKKTYRNSCEAKCSEFYDPENDNRCQKGKCF